MEWLPDAWPWLSAGLATLLGLLGRRSIWLRCRAAKRAVFDLGSMAIQLEAAEADNRALTEALRRCRAANALLSDVCDALPVGYIASSTATSPTAPNDSPPTPS